MFDVTLGPLIQLWGGFGSREPADPIPAEADIAAAMEAIGQTRLLTLDEAALTLAKAARIPRSSWLPSPRATALTP